MEMENAIWALTALHAAEFYVRFPKCVGLSRDQLNHACLCRIRASDVQTFTVAIPERFLHSNYAIGSSVTRLANGVIPLMGKVNH
jgi:hypothetical protein